MEQIGHPVCYDWGKKGLNSVVATFAQESRNDFRVRRRASYAKFEILECPGYEEWPLESFRATILSMGKALPLQTHPTKSYAETLRLKFPRIYKDPWDKPKLAIALTPFEVLCGFRPVEKVTSFLYQIPELSVFVKEENKMKKDTVFLKLVVRNVLTHEKHLRINIIDSILKRFKTESATRRERFLANLVEELHRQFPYDVGILMVYFLNYIKLEPFQAIYLAANEPYTYLSGDCLEVTNNGENVIRAGLTSDIVCVETFCNMVTYKPDLPENKIFGPMQEKNRMKIYKVPAARFVVVEFTIPKDVLSYLIIKREFMSIFIVEKGRAAVNNKTFSQGKCFRVQPNVSLAISNIQEDLHMFQVYMN